jgi:hypothetical protein
MPVLRAFRRKGIKLSINWGKVEKVFRIFFPEFSNKVTWLVVGGGLGLTSSSLIQAFVNYISEHQYNIQVFGTYDSLVGIILIILGLSYNILLQREKTKIELNKKEETNQKAIEHDLKLFEKLDGLLNDEYLFNLLENIETNHAYYFSYTKPLTDFMYEIEKVKTKFVLEPISNQQEKLKPITSEFDSFLINNFDVYGPGRADDHFMCLHPNWNCDRGGRFDDYEGARKYDESVREMFEVFDKYRIAYKGFRHSIKSNLFV